MRGGGVTLNYGKNGWKKWNFDLSTIVKMNEKIPKKIHFSPCIMSIWKKVLIISVVSRNCIFWNQKFKFLHIVILNIIFSQILEKQNFFTNLKYGNFIDFFEKKVKKTRILNLLIHCNFNIFFEKKKSKNDFFSIELVLVYTGISTSFKHKKNKEMNFLNYWRVLHVLGFINICSWLMITYQTNFSKMILRRPYHVYLSAFQLLWQRKYISQK